MTCRVKQKGTVLVTALVFVRAEVAQHGFCCFAILLSLLSIYILLQLQQGTGYDAGCRSIFWSLLSTRIVHIPDGNPIVRRFYGPIVLGGRLAEVDHPFSDPTKHNDYYTFNYGKHADVKLGEVKHQAGLRFESNGIQIQPFYDLQHCRYVVYWKK